MTKNTGKYRKYRNSRQTGTCMHITFLLILLIFSSPEGYQLQFSFPRVYFVYTAQQCTGQQCSFLYACILSFVCWYMAPLVSVTITLYYAMLHVCIPFHLNAQRIFNKIKVRASSSYPRLPLCQIPFLSWPPLLS